MALKMHSNMLAVYPELLAKVGTIDGIKTVKEAGELAVLLSGMRESRVGMKAGRQVAPLPGAVYVVYGGHALTDSVAAGKAQKNTLYFTLIYCASYTEQGKSTLLETGAVLTAIKHTINGWDPGREFALGAFQEIQAPAIEYNDGFAFYPITFTTEVALVSH